MMSLKSKRELLEVVRPKYLKASKVEKQKILDEFTSATGYHRKYAIRVLRNKVQAQNHLKGKTKTYKTIYRGEVVQALEQIWEIYGEICSKRLQPILPEAIKVLERCREIEFSKDTKELLLKISSATSKRPFINQDVVMLFGGSWDFRYFSENVKFDWSVFASPAPDGSQTTVIFQPDIAIGINNQVSPAHQKAALRFLEWLMTEQSLNLTNEILPGFFPLSNTQIQPSNNTHSAEFQQLIKDYPTDLCWAYSELYATNQVPRASELIQRGLSGIVNKKLSSQEAANQYQAGMAEWYEPAQKCNQ